MDRYEKFISSFAFVFFYGCKQSIDSVIPEVNSNSSSVIKSKKFSIPYRLEASDTIFVLDPVLDEISGLDYDERNNSLVGHNDEKGSIYTLDIDSGKIIAKSKFAKSGDYEGIAILSDQIYVTNNSGKLFAYNTISKETESYKTPLSARNDVEGLCVDKNNNILLMACKGQPIVKTKMKDKKSIYAYNLSSNKLIERPYLTILDDELEEWVKTNYQHMSVKDQKNKIKRAKEFSPSGLSYTRNQDALYIISAKGSTLLIFDNKLNLISIHFLNTKTIPQPEGICFDKNNNLYISTEGHGFSGKIFKYKHHDQ